MPRDRGEAADLAHDVDVVGEAGVLNDFELVAQALSGRFAGVGNTAPQSLPAEARQVLVRRLARRQFGLGQVEAAELQLQVAVLGHATVLSTASGRWRKAARISASDIT